MNVVIPMAGAGSRFVNAGFELPKPLIPVRGEPMYRWAVSSLDLSLSTNLIFILRAGEHVAALAEDIRTEFRAYDPKTVVLDRLTRGQAETVLLAGDLVDQTKPILIHNADTAFTSAPACWAFGARDGALLTFDSTEDRWSFARTDAAGRVREVAEKRVISRHASTGTYYFRDTVRLFEHLRRLVASDQTEELYLGPMYNDLIAAGGDVGVADVDQLLCFGTPADLEQTLALIEREGITRDRLVTRGRAPTTPPASV